MIFLLNTVVSSDLFQKIAKMAHAHGALVLVDNSIMSPVLSHPLELGAGIVQVLFVPLTGTLSNNMHGMLAYLSMVLQIL